MASRLALITGGMGGLGETISTKMADAGYRVAVTYSPSNKTVSQWTAEMKSHGYDFRGYACNVADFESCKACAEVLGHALDARHDLQEDDQGRLGRGPAHQPRFRLQHDQAGL